MMIRRWFAASAAILAAFGLFTVTGCGNKDDHVELDSSKTVPPKTAAQIQAIRDNPHIPPGVKAQMLGHGGSPPATQKTGQ